MEENLISSATKNNWNRLDVKVSDLESRLSKRANKRYSTKNIIPLEYFSNRDNILILNNILLYVKDNKLGIKTVIYNLALNFLRANGLITKSENGDLSSSNKYLMKILNDFSYLMIDKNLLSIKFPADEQDFLGIVYQSLLKEGSKNKQGSYYTPHKIVEAFIKDLNSEAIFLDPCCGTGSFLLTISDKILDPRNLYGCDIDEVACFISKINLIVKFKDIIFKPNIYNIDFLLNDNILNKKKFDVVATNPPWGAMTEGKYKKLYPLIQSGESFSYFIMKSYCVLKKDGYCAFVLPESILNVGVHKDIRKFILDNFSIQRIQLLGKAFSGVLSDVVFIELNKTKSEDIQIISDTRRFKVAQSVYENNVNYNFSLLSNIDSDFLNKIYSVEYETLNDSIWALGIVTGDNKKHIINSKKNDCEKIYTGKEISKYFLKETTKYIKYDRDKFQQVAPDSIYRAGEKLVYKFISKKLVFAYDNSSSLFLNSANILIPKMITHSVKTALALLNSEIFQYIYLKKFNELKILKGNLLQLPFPVLSSKNRMLLEQQVDLYYSLKSREQLDIIENFVYSLFKLSPEDISYIRNELNAKIN